jgi:hypothetical protein
MQLATGRVRYMLLVIITADGDFVLAKIEGRESWLHSFCRCITYSDNLGVRVLIHFPQQISHAHVIEIYTYNAPVFHPAALPKASQKKLQLV